MGWLTRRISHEIDEHKKLGLSNLRKSLHSIRSVPKIAPQLMTIKIRHHETPGEFFFRNDA